MIGWLRGVLVRRQEQGALIECHGVGYVVALTGSALAKLPAEGETVTYEIHTHVREDALALFGFVDEFEKSVFELLLSVSGVGPKMAMNILSGVSPAVLVSALGSEDVAVLTKIPGVGKKTAERLVVELKGAVKKLGRPVEVTSSPTTAGRVSQPNELYSALVNLGYRPGQIDSLVERVTTEFVDAPLERQLRECLSRLRTG